MPVRHHITQLWPQLQRVGAITATSSALTCMLPRQVHASNSRGRASLAGHQQGGEGRQRSGAAQINECRNGTVMEWRRGNGVNEAIKFGVSDSYSMPPPLTY